MSLFDLRTTASGKSSEGEAMNSSCTRMSAQFILMIALTGLATAAYGQAPADIAGWWRATVRHDGEADDIYLHFQTRNGKDIVSFSIPSVATDDFPLSLYTASSSRVRLTSVGSNFDRQPDGSLSGILPEGLVPRYKLAAVFHRSSAPKLLAPARPKNSPPKPIWSQNVGAPVFGGLSYDAASKRLLVGTTSGKLVSLDARTGARSWSVLLPDPIRSAPLVDGRTIYVATDRQAVALDARSGQHLWSADIGQPKQPILPIDDPKSRYDEYSAAPVAYAGILYVGSRDGCVHALSATTGAKVRDYCATDSITGKPVIVGGRIYFPSFDGKVYAARLSDGSPLWTYDTQGAVPHDLAETGKLIIAGSRSYDLVAIDKSTGHRAWTRYVWWSWVDSFADVGRHEIVMGSSDAQRIYDLNAVTGRPIWTTFLGGWAWPKPARSKSLVYAGLVGTAMPYVGKRAGGLAALDARTGALQWIYRTPHGDKDIESGFATSPVVVGNRVYAADLGGKILAFDAK